MFPVLFRFIRAPSHGPSLVVHASIARSMIGGIDEMVSKLRSQHELRRPEG